MSAGHAGSSERRRTVAQGDAMRSIVRIDGVRLGLRTRRPYRPASIRALAKVFAKSSTIARTPFRTASETSSLGPYPRIA